jgi:tRNA threonylcarbamoyl adenosine modification protein (Sua5/YciO/YrdC/YwlC family)
MRKVEVDPWNPRPDQLQPLVDAIARGQLVAFPTDTTWVIAASPFKSAALGRLEDARARMHGSQRVQKGKPMSLLCGQLSTIGTFTLMDQPQFRLVKRLLPGPYTLLLPTSIQVPRQLQSKRNVLGIRMASHALVETLFEMASEPLIVATARTPDGELIGSVVELEQMLQDRVDVAVETEPVVPQASTVLDLTGQGVRVLRQGAGPVDPEWELATDEAPEGER